MTEPLASGTALSAILDRIASEVRPKLGQDTFDGGYDCCGCSSYTKIVEDIEAIVRDVLASGVSQPNPI